MMNKIIVVAFFFFMANSIVVSQDFNSSAVHTVSIITAQINFVDTVVVGYQLGPVSRNINSSSDYSITKLHYVCNLTVKLNGDNFEIDEPLAVKCLLPNNTFQTAELNSERNILTSDQFYYFNFDILSDIKLNGWVTLELDKDKESGQPTDYNIRYDRETIYIH